MDFHSHFPDDSDKNTAATFENMKKIINWMYNDNLFIKYGIICDTKYVCSKQYRCANEMWLLYVLEFKI